VQAESVDRAISAHDRELSNLTKLRLRELIDDTEFRDQRKQLDEARLRLVRERDRAGRAHEWIEPCRTLVSFSQLAVSRFRDGDLPLKRLILETVGSNPTLTDGILSIQAKLPFRRWSQQVSFVELRALVQDVTTLSQTANSDFQQMVANVKKIIVYGRESKEKVA